MKLWYQSKTMWLGIGTLVVSILTFTQGHDIIQENPQAVAYVGLAVGILTIVLRYITTTEIK